MFADYAEMANSIRYAKEDDAADELPCRAESRDDDSRALWDSRFDDETKVWAVLGLARLHTPEATAELESYAAFLDGLADVHLSLKATVADVLGNPPR